MTLTQPMNLKRHRHLFLMLVLGAILMLTTVLEAHARSSFSSARSYTSSSRSYSAPKAYKAPRPAAHKPVVVKKKTVVNRTTVVQQNVIHQSAPAAGGGFMSSFMGGAAGSVIGNWLMDEDEPVDQIQEATEAVQEGVQEVAK